jgi:hypothetical protein
MTGSLFSFCASGCASLSNFFIRKNAQPSESSSCHLALHFLTSLILCFLFIEALWEAPVSIPMLLVGAAVGVCNVVLMIFTMQAIQRGPSGLIFSFHAASLVFPALILFFLFGPEFGFEFTILQALGIALVLGGLYIASSRKDTEGEMAISKSWIKFAFLCFLVQILAFTLIQWRCLLFEARPEHVLIPTQVHEREDIWFMPGLFGSAFLSQMAVVLWERQKFKLKDMSYGFLSGCANSGSTYFLTIATKLALPLEKALLFPCFAVGTIILCNAWASKFYNEKFNFRANTLCSLGILVGSIKM